MEEKKESIWRRILVKITSFKNITAIWSMVMFTIMLVTKQEGFSDLGWGLLAIIGGDITANVIQHKINK